MNQIHRRVLQHLTVEFVRQDGPRRDEDTFVSRRECWTRDEVEQLGLPIHTTRSKCMLILTKLPTKGADAFDRLVECLEETVDKVPGHVETAGENQ